MSALMRITPPLASQLADVALRDSGDIVPEEFPRVKGLVRLLGRNSDFVTHF